MIPLRPATLRRGFEPDIVEMDSDSVRRRAKFLSRNFFFIVAKEILSGEECWSYSPFPKPALIDKKKVYITPGKSTENSGT